MKIVLQKELQGKILDIGGGGEGIIGRLYGPQVIAIDYRQDELDEAPASCEKRLMDATALDFADNTFDHVTAFFTMMFMAKESHAKAIAEAARVLRPGGQLHIWDVPMETASPFLVDLEIDLAGQLIRTTYGVGKADAQQDAAWFLALGEQSGLQPVGPVVDNPYIELRFAKSPGRKPKRKEPASRS